MYQYTKIAATITLCATVALSAMALAGKASENDALAIMHAKISLTQAITAAEGHTQGKAVKAEFEQTKSGHVFEVEIVKGTQVFDVVVDADKGSIVSSKLDKEDHDEKDNDDDEDKK